MDSEFSEFSYGFAYTSELVEALRPLRVAPIFPSLLAEAKLGWDLKLQTKRGAVVFVQFKVPFACTRASALEWDAYGRPYYRLYIRRRKHSTQHNRLKRLSQRERYVYYVAPCFYTLEDFNLAYVSNDVFTRSVGFPLRTLPRLDDDGLHYICYRDGSDARWCSAEPEPVKAEQHDLLLRSLAAAVLDQPADFSKERLLSIRENLISTVTEAGFGDVAKTTDNLARDIVYLARTHFNAEPIFLTASQ